MSFGLIQTLDATSEPVVLADAKTYLRIDSSDTNDDSLVNSLIKAARLHVERYTKRALISQKWDLWLDGIPSSKGRSVGWWDGVREAPISVLSEANGMITIPKAPVISVDQINTFDLSDASNAMDLSTIVLQLAACPPVLFPKIGQIWPVPIRPRQGVQVSFTAGYGATAATVPQDFIQAMNLLIAHFYENRSVMVESRLAETPFSVRALLDPYRLVTV